jgi:uncharacterized protein involved in type VI secretion and phage assembly
MPEYAQSERPLIFTTGLGKDVLLPTAFRRREAISSLFCFQLEFQHITVADILKHVLAGLNVNYEITAVYYPRDYCVQYRESDFDLATRLMEDEVSPGTVEKYLRERRPEARQQKRLDRHFLSVISASSWLARLLHSDIARTILGSVRDARLCGQVPDTADGGGQAWGH